MSDPTQQPPSDPYRPQDPSQGPGAPGGPTPPPQGPPQQSQNPYGQNPYGQNPYPQPMFNHAPQPNHPQATTSMVLGIVSLVGFFLCLIPILLAPVAWVMGGKAVKEIDASGGALGGRGEAQTGKITGIVGTVFLVLGILAAIVIIVIIVATANESDSDYSYDAVRLLLGR